MHRSIFNFSKWKIAGHSQQLAWMKSRMQQHHRPSGNSVTWYNDGSLSPLDLYCFLKARFGEPNGVGMIGAPSLFQWHYVFFCEDSIVQLIQLPYRTEFWFQNVPNLKDEDWKLVVQLFRSEFAKATESMSRIRKSLEKWTLFINPYKRIKNVVDSYSDRLKNLHIPSIELPVRPKTHDEFATYWEGMKKCWEIYDEGVSLGVSVKFLVPVMGEALVNLLILLLAKPEIKNDERWYNGLIRRNIDIRVKELPLYCNGFIKQVDGSADEFKKFHSLMNSRNDVLHGNIDPKQLMLHEIYFDGKIPLMKTDKPASEFTFSHAIKTVEPETIVQEISVVENFISFLLNHLELSVRKEVEAVMEIEQLGWNPITKRVGVLFPDEPYEAYAFPVLKR